MTDERQLEEEILASFERGEWKPVRNQKRGIARLTAAAEATLLKNKRAAGWRNVRFHRAREGCFLRGMVDVDTITCAGHFRSEEASNYPC